VPKELGMDSLAITDHVCFNGGIEFFIKAKAKGIKPNHRLWRWYLTLGDYKKQKQYRRRQDQASFDTAGQKRQGL